MTKFNTRHQNMSKTRHQNGTKNNNTSTQMLIYHCYTMYINWVCCCSLPILKKKSFGEGTLIDLLWPCPLSTTGRILPKSQNRCAGVMSTLSLPSLVNINQEIL